MGSVLLWSGMFRLERKLVYLSAACLILFYLQVSVWADPQSDSLERELVALLSHSQLKGARVGISVVSLPEKEPVFNYNDEELFVVASNMKLFTTAASLVYLGPDFQFETTLYTQGNLCPGGKLEGNIIIKGGGDPNISGRFYDGRSTAILEEWARALKGAGVTEISGDVVADDTRFDRQYVHPNWPKDQLSRWYCAPVSGLSLNDNCVELTVLSQGNGKAKVLLEPDTGYVKVFNSCRVGNSKKGSKLVVRKKPGSNDILIKGEVSPKRLPLKYFIAMDNPPHFLASVFKEVLEQKDITVRGSARLIDERDENSPWPLVEVSRTTSSMMQSVTVANTRSQNFYAEQILKTLGAELKGEGSFRAGLEVIEELLGELGYTPKDYQIADGSGLSRDNRFSPKMITDLLSFMYLHNFSEAFLTSLPLSGTNGSLQQRLTKEPYKGRVRAKTGYLSRVSALSGYVDSLGGKPLAFSIIMNDFKASPREIKGLQDSMCQVLVRY